MSVAILLLAAGRSARMRGADKLCVPLDGVPLLRVMALRAVATGWPVYVTLPPNHPRHDLIGDLDVQIITIDGLMGDSIAAGLAALPAGTQHALIGLADMPEITTADLCAVADAAQGSDRIWRGACGDIPGHPVALPARLFAMAGIKGRDHGLGRLIAAEDTGLVPLPGQAAITDLDTPEDWAAWRSRQGQNQA